MTGIDIILGVVLGLLVNEMCDISPWLARGLVRWAARVQYGATDRAAIRSEELTALINERPGKLFKLMTALTFAIGAALVRVSGRVSAVRRALPLVLALLRSWVPIGPLRRYSVSDGETSIDMEFRGNERGRRLVEQYLRGVLNDFPALGGPGETLTAQSRGLGLTLTSTPEPASPHPPDAPEDGSAPPRIRR
ncbi:hypothetical protein ACIBQ1_40140 [Nonomuraea sp. NPDC050153]|uniref:hypothetical protein n=1 Tax=Nonomuraea sp. NPDC050153 TaxID=3364359 RepID=UPI0037BB5626